MSACEERGRPLRRGVPRKKPYVVAFAGARDAYQVPLALEERGRLAKLVTDLYVPRSLAAMARRLGAGARLERASQRSTNGLPFRRTKLVFPLVPDVLVPPKDAGPEARLARGVRSQNLIGQAAANTAKSHAADLFLYAGYAAAAFVDPELAPRKKVLFMYHPHIRPSADILKRDFKSFPEARSSEEQIDRDLRDEFNDQELSHADLVVCASSFTARSVREAGFSSVPMTVVPYGIDVHPPDAGREIRRRENRRRQFLFVGSGVHRKGLHLLVDGWKKAQLPEADLTLVCRNIEPWIEKRIEGASIELLRGVAADELERLYAKADVFVLPSLIEGFGYVYLEALRRGCFCIGTLNTGLPDLQLGPSEAAVLPAPDLEALVACLRATYARWKGGGLDAPMIAAAAARWPWARFRQGVFDAAS